MSDRACIIVGSIVGVAWLAFWFIWTLGTHHKVDPITAVVLNLAVCQSVGWVIGTGARRERRRIQAEIRALRKTTNPPWVRVKFRRLDGEQRR